MLRNSSLGEILIIIPALLLAFTIHELSHGLTAYLLGDPTAKRDGRLSLNPIRHIDPFGLILILVAGFGWAKPVMVQPSNLKNPKVDMAIIAIMGPLSNFIMAFLSIMLFFALYINVPNLPVYILNVVFHFSSLNVLLGVFNLLPIPPLDGSKVIVGILPDSVYRSLPPAGNYGMIILIILMFTGVTSRIILPLIEAIHGAFVTIAIDIFRFFM